MRGSASACGSATIINAISTGRGAAFAIDLRVKAIVELNEGKNEIKGQVGETSEDSLLIETCVKKVLEYFGKRGIGGKVSTTVDLPIAVGLSSSSAAANATVLATADALNREIEADEAINLGIEAAFEAGTTITGAYDDASASFLGGGVVTDNEKRKILKKFPIDSDLEVLILLPPEKSYTIDFDVEKSKVISDLVEIALEEALSENLFGAQTLNGLLYSSILNINPQPAIEALKAGAYSSGLTGTGPAFVAMCESNYVREIKKKWGNKAEKIIETRPSEEGARIENE